MYPQQTKTDEYWTMRNGKQIAIGDMTESHAKNLLRKLIREDRIIFKSKDNDLLPTGDGEWWKE
jgi:hypothetical protein